MKVEAFVLIYSPIKEVFAMLADPENQMKFDNEMLRSCEKLSDGPIGKGTRFRGDFKDVGKVEYQYSWYVENQLIEQETNLLYGVMKHRFIFEPTTGGTRLTQSIELDPNILGYALWPLTLKKNLTKRITTLNTLLKNYMEGLAE